MPSIHFKTAFVAALLISGCASSDTPQTDGISSSPASSEMSSSVSPPVYSGVWKEFDALDYTFFIPKEWDALDGKNPVTVGTGMDFSYEGELIATLRCPRSDEGFEGYSGSSDLRPHKSFSAGGYEAFIFDMHLVNKLFLRSLPAHFSVLEIGKKSYYERTCQLLSLGTPDVGLWEEMLSRVQIKGK